MSEQIFKTEWLGHELTIKTGRIALQADASVTVQYGETVAMANVVQAKNEREGVNFFPLMVDFEEKLYAAGIIKGSQWVKREGRPTDQSVLTGRMIDRAIRPLFNQDDRRDIQVIVSVLAVDNENDYDVVSLIAASAALAISGIDWAGPISGVRIGRIDGQFVFNPSYKQQALSDLDIIVSGTSGRLLMLEAAATDIADEIVSEAIIAGLDKMQGALDLINEMKAKLKPELKEKTKELKTSEELETEETRKKLLSDSTAWLKPLIPGILFDASYYTKKERKAAVGEIKKQLDQHLFDQKISRSERQWVIGKIVETLVDEEITRAILEKNHRVDGRKLTEIRPLLADTAILPRVHGSSLFSRGETQVMSIVTLGAPGLEQSLEGIEGASKKRYMHHYNFPPYSVGEVSPLRGTGRREIGHGALAEKAIMPLLPTKEEFPYTIRVVSETLGSNGSSSMASTCASTLALMDAGVPLKKPVAGIAIGLASLPDMSQWKIITDIQDLEDGNGGMDFKITGTDTGLTAIQLDTKSIGLDATMIKQAISQGRTALNEILTVLKNAIAAPRPELSPYAPRITSFSINPEKIGAIIGPGGKTINGIIDETGGTVSIDIEDDGLVMVCGNDAEMVALALNRLQDIVKEFKVGDEVKGKVVRLLDFGAFVALTPNQDGMVHVSELAPYRVEKPSDFINVGDEVSVKVREVDSQGRINLTMKGLAANEHLWKEEKGKSQGGSSFEKSPARFNNRPTSSRGQSSRPFRPRS
ncbi:MAG: polyribonucleotide nucleotidyltransferase [Patescibacteria group bacterium]|nr:polyribonucleotide nucleotidyltransferase [Patescibacteria group bacterium]MDD4466272.1 polyribonucleotide nucleotidyltransferase [Patescibacteria group bacterium]